MTNDNEGVVTIDGMTIDTESGEILEMPEGFSGDKLGWLCVRARQCREQETTWKQAAGYYKQGIGALLNQAGQKSIATEFGRASWRGRQNRTGDPSKIDQVAREFELDADQMTAIYATATKLDPKELDLLKAGVVPPEAIDALITESPSEWVQVDAPRLDAPNITKGDR